VVDVILVQTPSRSQQNQLSAVSNQLTAKNLRFLSRARRCGKGTLKLLSGTEEHLDLKATTRNLKPETRNCL